MFTDGVGVATTVVPVGNILYRKYETIYIAGYKQWLTRIIKHKVSRD